MSYFKAKIYQNPITSGAPLQTPLVCRGAYSAHPDLLAGFNWGLLLRGGDGRSVVVSIKSLK